MFLDKSLRPMLLKEVDKPFQDSNFIYELKYDGIRALMHVSNKDFKIYTRNGVEVSSLYPELKTIQKLVGSKKVIFDGEIVSFKNGKPSFSELQKRSHLKNKDKIEKIQKEVPVAFIGFDILYENKDLTKKKLMERKEFLKQYSDTDVFIKTKMYQNGNQLFQEVKKLGLEGIVAKEKDSLYYPGIRVSDWLKIKNFKKDYFYVHGYIKNSQKVSLLLGEKLNHQLFYVGKVSIMPDNILYQKLKKEKEINSQFVNFEGKANYIEPNLKILVNYMERTSDNHLRQPFIKK